MKQFFLSIALLTIITQCKPDFEPVEEIVYVSNSSRQTPAKTLDGCMVKYKLANSYQGMDEATLKKAVDEAFGLWQKVNKNLIFIESPVLENADLVIKFVEPNQIEKSEKLTPNGLSSFVLKNLSSLKKESSKQFAIVLDNTYKVGDKNNWDAPKTTKAIAYNIGFYLGMSTTTNTASIMYPIFNNEINRITKEDSIQINTLYLLPCKDTQTNNLPLKLKLSCDLITKDFFTNKAGNIVIKSSGILTVGDFLGDSTPDGKDFFEPIWGVRIPIDKKYYLVPNFPHGSVMYKLNNDKDWKSCKTNCEFATKGNEYIVLSVMVNQIKSYANVGAYDVEINYK